MLKKVAGGKAGGEEVGWGWGAEAVEVANQLPGEARTGAPRGGLGCCCGGPGARPFAATHGPPLLCSSLQLQPCLLEEFGQALGNR